MPIHNPDEPGNNKKIIDKNHESYYINACEVMSQEERLKRYSGDAKCQRKLSGRFSKTCTMSGIKYDTWLHDFRQLQEQVRVSGGFGLGETKEEVITNLRKIRQQIFEEEYANLY